MPTMPRLLVIDDEPLLIDAIRRMLTGEAQVTPCNSVEDAFAHLGQGESFDAILCDLHMSGRSGIEFHAELSRTTPQLAARLGFVTGGAVDDEGQDFISAHSERVLEKPFSRSALREMLKLLLA